MYTILAAAESKNKTSYCQPMQVWVKRRDPNGYHCCVGGSVCICIAPFLEQGMLYIDTLKYEQKVIAQAIIATDCAVFIQNCREELLQSCKTDAQREKAKGMSDQEVVFALLYQPEVRNNKKELNHRGYVCIPCETGEAPEYEEALDILPDTTTEKEIDALLVRESLNPIIDANTTPYQREVLYLRAKGYSNSDVAEVLGKTPSEVCHHKARTEEKLRKIEALRQLHASVNGND